MQVKREEDNPLFTLITVKPWPDTPWAAGITVLQEKHDKDLGVAINRIRVRFSNEFLSIETAREWAAAVNRACDVAERLERDGSVDLLELERIAAVVGDIAQAEIERLSDILHKRHMHPDYEYETTDGPRKAWDGSPDLSVHGWYCQSWDRYDYHEVRTWRRLKTNKGDIRNEQT